MDKVPEGMIFVAQLKGAGDYMLLVKPESNDLVISRGSQSIEIEGEDIIDFAEVFLKYRKVFKTKKPAHVNY